MKKPLTKTIKYGYGVAEFGYSLANNVEIYFFTFFMTNIAAYSLGMTAFVGMLSAILNTIMTPFYGAIIAKVKAMRWGRLRSWMILMPPLCILCYGLEFSRIGSNELIAAIFVILGTVFFDQFFSLALIAHASLVNVISNNAEERAMISARRGLFMSTASMLNSYLGAPLAALFALIVGETYGYTLMAVVLAFIMTLTFWFEVRITRGYEPTGDEDVSKVIASELEQKISVRELFIAAVKSKHVLALIISDSLRYTGNMILASSVAYYFSYIAENSSIMAYYLFFGGAMQVLGSFISEKIGKKFSTRSTAIFAMLAVGSLELLGRFLGFQVGIAFVTLMIYRMFHGFGIALYPALIADCAEYEAYKNDTPVSFTVGVIDVAPKIAFFIRAWSIPLILTLVGFTAEITPAAATYEFKVGILNMFLLIPGLITVASGLTLLFFYKITDKELAEIEQ
ncbi:MAG: MFS transporter [Eubacteriales bacterium]